MWLGIETSSLVSSLALLEGDTLLGELTMQAGLTHSEQLVPHIELLLNQARIDKSDLTGIVVAIGPGSFTGLRIGMGTAKAMAYALKIPLYGAMTMDGIAYNVPYTDRLISVLIDAQKKNVYEARYRWEENQLVRLQDPMVKSAADLVQELEDQGQATLFLGDGIKRVQKLVADRTSASEDVPLFTIGPATVAIPRAGAMLLAARDFNGGLNPSNPMTMIPYYIRRSEAEVMWEDKHKDDPEALAQNPQVTVVETVK